MNPPSDARPTTRRRPRQARSLEGCDVADRERDGDRYKADWPGPIDEQKPLLST